MNESKQDNFKRINSIIEAIRTKAFKQPKIDKVALRLVLMKEYEKTKERWLLAFSLWLKQTYATYGGYKHLNSQKIDSMEVLERLETLKRIGTLHFVFNTLQQTTQEKFIEYYPKSRENWYREFWSKMDGKRALPSDYREGQSRGSDWL